MKIGLSKMLSALALMALLPLASGCSETLTVGPEVSVPCRALAIVRVRPPAALGAMSDETVMQIDGNNRAISSGCQRQRSAAGAVAESVH